MCVFGIRAGVISNHSTKSMQNGWYQLLFYSYKQGRKKMKKIFSTDSLTAQNKTDKVQNKQFSFSKWI